MKKKLLGALDLSIALIQNDRLVLHTLGFRCEHVFRD